MVLHEPSRRTRTELMRAQVWKETKLRFNALYYGEGPVLDTQVTDLVALLILQTPNAIITFDLRVTAEAFGRTSRTSTGQNDKTVLL